MSEEGSSPEPSSEKENMDEESSEENAEESPLETADSTLEEATSTDEASEKSEDETSAEAFADQEATEETADSTLEEAATTDEASEKSEDETSVEAFSDQEATEETTSEEGDDGDEARIRIGPISVPATLTGKFMLVGGILGLLVTIGGAYFAYQTFAPPELAELKKTPSQVPEGMTPKPNKEQIPSTPEKSAKPTIPGQAREDKKSDIAKELKESRPLSNSTESVEIGKEESDVIEAALSPKAKLVKLSTIMPVAFDVNDIRVLSFTLEITFTDEDSAKVMQSALPIFEETTVSTIEKFLAKKFYNDILYVKEKLGKRLQLAYNKKIDSDGRVKKVKFQDFVIQ